MNPEDWFKEMREAVENPEKVGKELHELKKSSRAHKKTVPAQSPPLDYLREWEKKQEEREDGKNGTRLNWRAGRKNKEEE